MSSIALRTTATGSTLDVEGDLARRAARGDRRAFDEIFARHADAGWRLAQAVAADRASAVDSFRDGFVKAVKTRRLARRAAASPLRDEILSAVYGAASASSYDSSLTPASGLHRPAGGQDAALADAAFRSLPERWRAAVWLGEVESFANERIASVMAVSAAVALQLHTRGTKGLTARFVQSHREPPTQFGSILRALAIPAPTDLADFTLDGWDHVSARRPVSALPGVVWMQERGVRPLFVAAGTLLAFGLIGIGVIPDSSPVGGQLSAIGNSPLRGAVPVSGSSAGTAPSSASDPGALTSTGPSYQTVGVSTAGLGLAGIGPNLTGALAGIGSGTDGSATALSSGGGVNGSAGSSTTTGHGSGSTGSSGSGSGGSSGSGSGGSGIGGIAPTTTLPGGTAVSALGNTVSGAVTNLGTTVTDLTTDPSKVVTDAGNTVTPLVGGVGTAVAAVAGGGTSSAGAATTSPTSATTAPATTTTVPASTTTTTTCTLDVLGLCVKV